MKKRLQNWRVTLSSAFPSASNPYWRALPLRRMRRLLAGAFFAGTVMGLVFNLLQLNLPPLDRGFFWPVLLGGGRSGTPRCQHQKSSSSLESLRSYLRWPRPSGSQEGYRGLASSGGAGWPT